MTQSQFIEDIDDLLDDDRFKWAFETLCGIRDTVSKSGYTTEGQRQALANIRGAVSVQQQHQIIHGDLPSERFKASRRYDGYLDSHHKTR